MKHNKMKRPLAVLLAVLLLLSTLMTGAFAASSGTYGGKYGRMIPTDSKYRNPVEQFSLTGEKGNLYFYFDSKGYTKNVYYNFAVFSDEELTKTVVNANGEFPSADSETVISWNLSEVKSGTYYGITFTSINTKKGVVVDEDSIYAFEITVNRLGKVIPKITSLKTSSKGGVTVKWDAVKFADSYTLYRKAQGSSSWSRIATVSDTTYTDLTAKTGLRYTYTLRASDGEVRTSYNKAGWNYTYLAASSFTDAGTVENDNRIRLAWTAVPAADGYLVYYKTPTSDYTCIAKLPGGDNTSYTDTAPKTDGETYIYLIRAYSGTDKGIPGAPLAITLDGVKQFTAVRCADGVVTLEWASVEGVTGYRLYRRSPENSEPVLVLDSWNALSYTDTNIDVGKEYRYSLTTYRADGFESSLDTVGVPVRYLGTPLAPKATGNTESSVKVSWNAVPGASGYRVYRRTVSTEYEELCTVTGAKTLSCYDTTEKTNNLRYIYSVQAVFENSVSAMSEGRSLIYMTAPVIKGVKRASGANVVSWKAVSGATGYRVFRKTPGGSWKALSTVSGKTSYQDTSAKAGTAYYYTVCAMNGKTTGSYSAGYGIYCLNAPVLRGAVINRYGYCILDWTAISGAKGYYVYRKVPGGSWARIGKTAARTFTDKSALVSGTQYLYTVKAYNGSGSGLCDPFGISLMYVGIPKAKLDTMNSAGVTLRWDNVDGALSYTIYRLTEKGWKFLGNTAEASYTDSTVQNENVYTYTVRSQGASCYGGYDTKGIRAAYYLSPEITYMSVNAQNALTLKWSEAKSAVQYAVFRRTGTEDWTFLSKVNGTSYRDTARGTPGEVYEYYISYYTGKDYCVVPAQGRSYQYLATPEILRVENDKNGALLVSFSESAGAADYRIYRCAEDESDWTLLDASFTGTQYTDSSVTAGKRYSYTVKAQNGECKSGFVTQQLFACALPAVENVQAAYDEQGQAVITWQMNEFARSYTVFRATGEEEPVKVAEGLTEPQWMDVTASDASEYRYFIAAVSGGSLSYYGESVAVLPAAEVPELPDAPAA